jgi:hypothetical protein
MMMNDDDAFASLLPAVGTLPPQWGSLRNLTVLSTAYNQLSGVLPPEFGNLTSLELLWLSGNKNIRSELPASWGKLSQLQDLRLGSMAVFGGFPGKWSGLQKLKYLDLSGNTLVGSLPASWMRMYALQVLDLRQQCGVCGVVPFNQGELRQEGAVGGGEGNGGEARVEAARGVEAGQGRNQDSGHPCRLETHRQQGCLNNATVAHGCWRHRTASASPHPAYCLCGLPHMCCSGKDWRHRHLAGLAVWEGQLQRPATRLPGPGCDHFRCEACRCAAVWSEACWGCMHHATAPSASTHTCRTCQSTGGHANTLPSRCNLPQPSCWSCLPCASGAASSCSAATAARGSAAALAWSVPRSPGGRPGLRPGLACCIRRSKYFQPFEIYVL